MQPSLGTRVKMPQVSENEIFSLLYNLARNIPMNSRWQGITLLPSVTCCCAGKLQLSECCWLHRNTALVTRDMFFCEQWAVAAVYWQPNQQLQLTTHTAFRIAYKGVSCFSLVRKKEVWYHNQIKTGLKPSLFCGEAKEKSVLHLTAVWNTITPKADRLQEPAMNVKTAEIINFHHNFN